MLISDQWIPLFTCGPGVRLLLGSSESSLLQLLLICSSAAQWGLPPDFFFLLAGLDKDCRLTEPLGMRIAEFPLNPMFAKMLLESGG